MNGLDLFSGIGGIGLALEPWVRTVAYCEQDRYAQGVLLSRMQSGDIDRAPIWDDVRTLRKEHLPEIDIIFGGFPCQDISAAGVGRGMGGERSGLYTHIERLIAETKPTFVFLENVPAIRTRGLGRVVWGLASLGYDCRWTVISAASIGAPHQRDRWFLLAYANSELLRNGRQWDSQGKAKANRESQHNGEPKSLADPSSTVRHRLPSRAPKKHPKLGSSSQLNFEAQWWSVEPDVGRVAHGVPKRMDRLKCLGNAVVPVQARKAFEILIGSGGVK